MRTTGLITSCLAVVGLWPAPLPAQEPDIPARLSFDAAVRLVEQRHPALAAGREHLAIADATSAAARVRPNPVFDASSEGLRPWSAGGGSAFDAQELILQVGQEIELGGRRRLRTAAADAAASAARASLTDRRRRLRAETGQAYFLLVLARSEVETATTALADVDKVIALNRARYQQGEISGGELRRLEVERMRFTDDVLGAQLSERNARSSLLALLGSTRLDQPLEPTDQVAPRPGLARVNLDRATLVALALANRPDLVGARQDAARAGSEVRLQQALRTPNLTIGAGFRRDFGENGVILSASVPLPVFDRNAAGIARAEAERRLAESGITQVERDILLEVQQAINLADTSRSRLDQLESEYLQKAREARDSALSAYRSGAADLIDYLDAQRAYREVQRAHRRAEFDYRASLLQLEAAVGTAPGDQPQ